MVPSAAVREFAGTARYELLGLLGQGAMGRVHRVRDRQSGREIALKTLQHFGAEDVFRLKKEFRVLSAIAHPNVIQLYDLVVEDDTCFFTMELVEGRDFVAHVDRDPARARVALRGVAAGLAALHGAGILHRDVKPSNVLVGERDRVVLLDFGLAFQARSQLSRASRAGGLAGTVAYMAPEQAWGDDARPASDWYSVGVMLFEALTGVLPFPEATLAALLDRRTSAPPRPRTHDARIPADLDDLVASLLDPDPAGRAGGADVLARRVPTPSAEAEPVAPRPELPRFVGRQAELDALRGVFDVARSGEPAMALIRGGSGIGKTALVRRFAAELAGAEIPVLRSACHPHESVPFKAFDGLVDELSRVLRGYDPSSLAAVMPRNVRALHRLFPVLERVAFEIPEGAPLLRDAEPHEVRRRGFAALRELIGRMADRGPMVFWIDDAQWGDADSQALMRELARAPDAPAVLWIASHRFDADATPAFPDELRRIAGNLPQAAVYQRELEPLDEDEVRALVERIVDVTVAVEDVAALARESGGSPLFVGELVRHGRGALTEGAQSIRLVDALRARVEALEPDERAVLGALAAYGEPASLDLAVQISPLRSDERRVLAALERQHLVRMESHPGGIAVELYHDRVHSAVLASLEAEPLREIHERIARTLESRPGTDAQALYRHHLAAGDRGRAAHHALEAAGSADALLAFGRAAELYRAALELDPTGIDRARVEPRLAEALANAGRGVEAAAVYIACADASSLGPSEVRRFRTSAAEQLMKSGRVEEGVDVLRPLLERARVSYPASPRAALVRGLLDAAYLRVRGTRFVEVPESDVPTSALEAIDVCAALGKGLGAVDSIRAAYFQFQAARRALAAGELYRVGRNLVLVGAGALGPAGGAVGRWGRRLVEVAGGIAERSDDPELRGASATSIAQIELFSGRWKQALEASDEGLRLLEEHGREVFWEKNIARLAATRALEELGRFGELRARAAAWEESARDLGDRYGQVTAMLNRAWTELAAGDTAAARASVERVLEVWSHPEAFHVQHLYALRVELYCDLYDGEAQAAADRLEQCWPALRRSLLLQFPLARIDVSAAVARIALARARQDPSRRRACLTQAAGAIRRLERERRADCVGHAASLRACLLAAEGDAQGAVARLETARSRFDEAEMRVCDAQARLVTARSATGSVEDGARSAEDLRAAGVREPERWTDVFLPGDRAFQA